MRTSLRTAITAFVASRVLCGLFVYLAHCRREYLSPVSGGWEGVENWWINPWTTYDSLWFISIARDGYQEHTAAFFPLYPLLLKLGGDTEIGMAIVGVFVSNASFLFALYIVHRLTEMDFSEKVAKITVFLLAFFPTTVFFSAVYADSLFLLLLLLTFYLARRSYWLMAGIMGLLAALTRNPGILVFFALVYEYIVSANSDRKKYSLIDIASISLPLVGFISVQAYFSAIFGNKLSGITSQQFYHRDIGWPWVPVWKDFYNISTFNSFDLTTFVNFIVIVFAFVLTVKYRNVLKASYCFFLLGIMLMHLTYQRIIPPYTIGAARYMAMTFPFAQLIAIKVNQLSLRPFFMGMAVAQYVFISFIMSYIFGLKGFLG